MGEHDVEKFVQAHEKYENFVLCLWRANGHSYGWLALYIQEVVVFMCHLQRPASLFSELFFLLLFLA